MSSEGTPSEESEHIAGRTVRGSAYSVGASAVTIALGFLRTTLMLRWLAPEHYGVTTLALFYVNLAGHLRGLGLDSAFIHRQEAADQDEEGLRTYFTLHTGLQVASLLLLLTLTPLLQRIYMDMQLLGIVLMAFVGIALFKGLNSFQMSLMRKSLRFREISTTDVASGVAMTLAGPLMAWQGYGVWSIVVEQFSGVLVRFIVIWFVLRPWRPRFGLDKSLARWYFAFGANVWAGHNLTFLIDRFDDFWIGTHLGSTPLGFYSRAYEYARYPRRVISNPILSVFFPAFARLQEDRLRLSRAFFRSMSLMVRGGALLTLLFILTAPEFIVLLLTDKWLPMLLTFQLMIVYTLLDPLSQGASNLLVAVGRPATVTRVRLLQAVVFIPGVILLSNLAGIEGVALAADLMIFLGALLLFWQTKQIIGYSSRTLWLWPLVSLAITASAVLLMEPVWTALPLWGAFMGKAALILLLYSGILWLAERDQLIIGWHMIRGLLPVRRQPPPETTASRGE